MTLNEFVDKIYCINLDKRSDRWKRCQEIFKQYNLDVERFSAVDGDTVTQRHDKLKPGEIAISRSNLAIIKEAKKKKYKSICILEDDIEFVEDFNQKFSDYTKQVPKDWAMIYFGGGNKRPVKPISKNISKLTKMYSAYAIIINHKIYDNIIKELTEEKRWSDVNYSILQSKYPCYVTIPYLAWVRDDYSDIQKRNLTYDYLKAYKERI